VVGHCLERRQVQILSLPASGYAKQFQPTDAELQTFYDSHLSDYQAPEAVDIEFVVLDADAMKKQASISDDDLKAYYDNNQATLGSPEERRASHILVAADKSAPAAEREKAKAEAEKLLDEVRKNPAAFAEVAKRASQDDASAAHGGDLGFFRKDRGIEPAIAEAAFALAHKGDISGVVESDYGYHIVHLTDLKPADVPAFDKVKDQLKEQLLAEQAQKLAAEHFAERILCFFEGGKNQNSLTGTKSIGFEDIGRGEGGEKRATFFHLCAVERAIGGGGNVVALHKCLGKVL